MSSTIERYANSLATLEKFDANLALLIVADDSLAQQFGRLESTRRRAASLMQEYGPEFLKLLDLPRSDRPETAIAEANEWMTSLERLTSAAQQSSDNCRSALSQTLSDIQSLDLPALLYLDSEAVEQSLSTARTFAQETRLLSPASLTSIQHQIARGLLEHAQTHVSRLLEGARDDALALLSELDARLKGIELIHQVAAAARAVNTDVRASYEIFQLRLRQLLETANFIAIVEPEVIGGISGLQELDISKIRETDIDLATSRLLDVVRISIEQSLSALQCATELRRLIPNAPSELAITMEGPTSFEEIHDLLHSIVVLVDAFARAAAILILESAQTTDALLGERFYIGKDAYAIKRKLGEQKEVTRSAKQRWSGLFSEVPTERVKVLLSNISDISPLIGVVSRNAVAIAGESDRLRAPSRAYDIASVIELQDGSPVGLRSLVQDAGNNWMFVPVTVGRTHDTQRTVCLSFPAGLVPGGAFKIELAPESILGDWVRWIGGGFMLRTRPATGPRWPRPPVSLQSFLKIHVFRQWAGKTRLQDLIDRANLAARQNPQECEAYFSKMET